VIKIYYKKKFVDFHKTDPAGLRESKIFFLPGLREVSEIYDAIKEDSQLHKIFDFN
jgi:hypothetical protein